MPLPDIDDLDALGGLKENDAAIEDRTREIDADDLNRIEANVAMATRTQPRCWARLTLSTTTGGMVLQSHMAVWGSASGDAPALVRSTTGVFTITWPTDVEDELGDTHTTNLRAAWASVEGATPYQHTETVTAANVVTLRMFTAAGVADDADTVTVDVFAI